MNDDTKFLLFVGGLVALAYVYAHIRRKEDEHKDRMKQMTQGGPSAASVANLEADYLTQPSRRAGGCGGGCGGCSGCNG